MAVENSGQIKPFAPVSYTHLDVYKRQGHGMVTDHTVLQREDGRKIVRGAAHHSKGLIACFQHGLLAGIHCHNAGLVEHLSLIHI